MASFSSWCSVVVGSCKPGLSQARSGPPCLQNAAAAAATAWAQIIHHSLGKPGDLDFELNCFKQARHSELCCARCRAPHAGRCAV